MDGEAGLGVTTQVGMMPMRSSDLRGMDPIAEKALLQLGDDDDEDDQ